MSARESLYLFAMVGKVQEDGNRSMAVAKLDAYRAEVLAELAAGDLTVYRASHDSIVMGLYTTAAEARRHCETVLLREYEGATVKHWWPEPEDDEDTEAELFAHVTPKGFDTGRTWRTGYVVTALTVSAKYDEE
ncbi:hypothetical protein, partial [Streptomyces sp. NPDC005953]|uniref:hypothetical protein n=1 Tax=Streptomyces sp. NPDC005953 TaxID=3156719 RepID=UPI00340C5E64